MNDKDWQAVDDYYEELLLPADQRLNQIAESVRNANMPEIAVSPLYGRFMEILIKTAGMENVLEIGTLGGFSTAWLACGLPPQGRLISLEIDPERAQLARKNLEAFDFKDRIEIREGDALQLMTEMIESKEGPFDLIFIDADKSQYPDYLDLALQLSRTGTLIIADNVIKHGRVFNEAIETPSQQGIVRFHEKVASDPRLAGSVIQTVGRKGHDGLAFIRVRRTNPTDR